MKKTQRNSKEDKTIKTDIQEQTEENFQKMQSMDTQEKVSFLLLFFATSSSCPLFQPLLLLLVSFDLSSLPSLYSSTA